MIPRLALVAVCAIALSSRDARAQTVPLISGEVTIGAGSTSSHGGNTWFRTASSTSLSTELAIRIGGVGRTRVVAVLGYSPDAFPTDHATDCPLAPNGTCKGYFPNTHGPEIGVGLRQVLGQNSLIGVNVGIASYASQARFAEFEASWRIASHFGLVGKFRYLDMPFEGDRVWFAPITAGAFISW